jgi:hypothetical protein
MGLNIFIDVLFAHDVCSLVFVYFERKEIDVAVLIYSHE